MENSAFDTLDFTKKSLDLLMTTPCNEKVTNSVINVTILTISAFLQEHSKKRKADDIVEINNNSEKDDENDGYTTPITRTSFIKTTKKNICKTPEKSENNAEKSSDGQVKKSKKTSFNSVNVENEVQNTNGHSKIRDINYSVYNEIFNSLAKIANEYKSNLIYQFDDKMLYYSMREMVFTVFKVKLTDESYIEFCEKIAEKKMDYLREKLLKMKTKEELPIRVQKIFDKLL